MTQSFYIFTLRLLVCFYTVEHAGRLPDWTHQNIESLRQSPSATQAWILATNIAIRTLHVHMSAILL